MVVPCTASAPSGGDPAPADLSAENRKRKRAADSNENCSWTGPHRDLSSHESECDFVKIECPYGCVGESEGDGVLRVRRCDMEEHCRVCVRAPVSCPTAGCEWSGNRSLLSSHLEDDCEALVVCPNDECEELPFQRKHLTDHLNSCPHQIVSCPLSVMGCQVPPMARKALQKHLQQDVAAHFQIMIENDMKREQAMKEMEEKHQQKTKEIEAKLLEKTKEIGELKREFAKNHKVGENDVLCSHVRGRNVVWRFKLVNEQRKLIVKMVIQSDKFIIGRVQYWLKFKPNPSLGVDCFGLYLHRDSGAVKTLRVRFSARVRSPDGSKKSTEPIEFNGVWSFHNHVHRMGYGSGVFVSVNESFISEWVDGDGYVAIAASVLESDEPIYEVPSWNSGAPLLQLNSQ